MIVLNNLINLRMLLLTSLHFIWLYVDLLYLFITRFSDMYKGTRHVFDVKKGVIYTDIYLMRWHYRRSLDNFIDGGVKNDDFTVYVTYAPHLIFLWVRWTSLFLHLQEIDKENLIKLRILTTSLVLFHMKNCFISSSGSRQTHTWPT